MSLFKNVCSVLNENGEIVEWRLTKSSAFHEISDLLTSLKQRLGRKETSLAMICIDDCCKSKSQYLKIFPDAEIIIGLVPLMPTCSEDHWTRPLDFNLEEFGFTFRQWNDLDEVPTRDTGNEEEIEANLESLFERWRNVPSLCLMWEKLKQIENLTEHIKKGCLSGIPPGFGTETDTPTIKPFTITRNYTNFDKLAAAFLTVSFYSISCRVPNMNHKCSAKVHFIQPAQRNVVSTDETSWSPFKTASSPITVAAACQSINEKHLNLRLLNC